MKTRLVKVNHLLCLLALCAFSARAIPITWTNTAGGFWNSTNNWSPNQVPAGSDTALITNSGTYAITLDISVAVSSLTLGGSSGQQTLNTLTNNFSVNSASLVDTNGVVALSGGTLFGNFTINGLLNWSSGTLGSGPQPFVIGASGTLVFTGANGITNLIQQPLTSAGTVRIVSGNLQIAYCGGGQYGAFVNLPAGLVDMTGDVSFGTDGCSPGFNNQGTLRKSGGTGTNNIYGAFSSSGTVYAQTGTISLNSSGRVSGLFDSGAGASVAFTSGSFVLTSNLVSSNAVLAGGVLYGNGNINGLLNWTGGALGQGANTMELVAGSTIVLAGTNGSTNLIQQFFTNAGTIRVVSGNLEVAYCGGSQYGSFVNVAGAVVDLAADVSFGTDTCGPGINNQGTIRKSAGTGTSFIFGNFLNTGMVDAQSGTINLNGANSGSGLFTSEGAAALIFTGNFVLSGNLVSSNAVLAGGTLYGNGTISGLLNWTNGTLGYGSGTLELATNSTIVLAGTNGGTYLLQQYFTNAGTVRIVSGNLEVVFCGGGQYGSFLNLPGALVDMAGDVSFSSDGCGPGINNQGTIRKSAGTGTNGIFGIFANSGTLDAQSGTIAVSGNYSIDTNSIFNTGINSLSNYGVISFAGPLAFPLTYSANLNGGYVPAMGNSFATVSFASSTNSFVNTNLPVADAWSTNYTPTSFVLTVLNARPILAAIPTQTVNELTSLSFIIPVTDPDRPAQNLTFALLAGPSGLTLNSNTGGVSWTPTQAQSPSTNTVTVSVTDSGTPALSATNSFTIIVKEVNVAPTLPSIASQAVNVLALLTVTNTASEFNIHASTVGYGLIAPPAGASINSNGIITWTPSQAQGPGTYTITTVVTNFDPYDTVKPNLTATNSFTVTVFAPSIAPIGNVTVNVGQTVSFTPTAIDNDPTRTLTYSLGTAPAGASINAATGLFTWRPTLTNANSTNTVVVRVTANSTPSDTVSQSFMIIVNPLTPVTLAVISNTATQLQLQVTGPIGPDYFLQETGSLSMPNWVTILTNTPTASPFTLTTTNVPTTNEFYRIKLGP